MRRRIRLTGRKQLSRTSANIRAVDLGGKRLLALTLNDPREYSGFPRDAKVLVKLAENKQVEIVQFGTLESPRVTAELQNAAFVAPSCQLRVVATDRQREGLLLGSTDSWTLSSDSEETGKKGILLFQAGPTEPRVWRLDIRDSDYPVVYVNERIQQAKIWAKTDPTFVGAVLPAIVAEVFEDIISSSGDSEPDAPWMKDWMSWADVLMPGVRPPYGLARREVREWIGNLIDSFCNRHHIADRLVRSLVGEGEVQ